MISKQQPMRSAEIDLVDEVNNLDALTAQHTTDIAANTQSIEVETLARADGDSAIESIIGTGFDSTNTVASAVSGLDSDITTIEGEIGTGFDSTNTVAKAISDEAAARAAFDSNVYFEHTQRLDGGGYDLTLPLSTFMTIKVLHRTTNVLTMKEFLVWSGNLNSANYGLKTLSEDQDGYVDTVSITVTKSSGSNGVAHLSSSISDNFTIVMSMA